jgi:translation initiation factor IF-1
MPRNTTGGKNFKKFKTGSEGFRAKASREAADDMIDLIRTFEKTEPDKISASDKEAAKYMFAGRIVRKFGHGRMEVYCHDGVTRQCKIRGLLRKKGQCFMDVDSLVVVSLREAVSSEDEDAAMAELGPSAKDGSGGGDIIGVFDDKQKVYLAKTKINPRLFATTGANGEAEEDIFDRSDLIKEDEEEDDMEGGEKKTKPKGRSQKGAERSFTTEVATGGGGACNEIINIDDI